MKNLSKNEKELNQLINKMKIDFITPERDKLLKEVLEYVSTISQDGGLEKLLKSIKNQFPEYGS
jgi:hypothetical protein